MKISYVTTFNIQCGIGMYGEKIANEMANLGYNISILAEDFHGCYFKRSDKESLPATRCWIRTDPRYRRLLEAIANEKPDILHFQHEYGFFPYEKEVLEFFKQVKAENPKVKIVVTCHTTLDRGQGFEWFFSTIQYVDAIIVPSESAKKVWIDNVFQTSKIHLIPLGVDDVVIHDQTEARLKLGLPLDKKILLSTGFINQSKRLRENMVNVAQLVKEGYSDILYIIAGFPVTFEGNLWNDLYYQELVKTFEKLNLPDNIMLLKEFIDEEKKSLLFSAADISVSNYGWTPHSISAMSHDILAWHKASISSDAFINDDLLGVAHRIPIGDAQAFVDGVRKLVKSNYYAGWLSECAEEKASKMTWTHVAQLHERLYSEVIRGY